MSRRASPQPTEAELAILKVLWREGPSTVRQVHEALEATLGTGYTTILKQMQIMAEKGLVRRHEQQRSHIYEVVRTEAQTLCGMTSEWLERVFDGSAQKLLLHALSGKRTSRKELDAIRSMLDELEKKEPRA